MVTMKDLVIVASDDSSVSFSFPDLKNPVVLKVLKYERGAVVEVPWALKDRLGATEYGALKMVLRPLFGRIETRTEVDPRFTRAAEARSDSAARSHTRKPSEVYAS